MIGKNYCGLLFLCDNGYRQLLIVTKEDTQQFQALAIKQAFFGADVCRFFRPFLARHQDAPVMLHTMFMTHLEPQELQFQ